MKKLAAMLIAAMMMGAPMASLAEEMKESWDKELARGTEDFGKGFFEYMGGVMMYPVHVTEKAVRTLLFMDHHE